MRTTSTKDLSYEKKNTLHVSKNSYLQTRLCMPPSIPPHNRGHQSKQAVPCSSLMPWWQRRRALLWGLPERLPTSMSSTHLSFLSKSNQPTLPQMGHCFSQMNSAAFWFVLATKSQLLYQFWGKHGIAKQDTRYFKLQLPQAILYSSLVYPHTKKDSIVRIRWFGRCEGFPTMAKYSGLGKKENKKASWASPFGYQTTETMGPIEFPQGSLVTRRKMLGS